MQRIVITGAGGLLGWHAYTRLYASNCADAFAGRDVGYDIVPLSHEQFQNDEDLDRAVRGADAVLHFAGVNRAEDSVIARENPAIAQRLLDSMHRSGCRAHVAYSNSTHSAADTVYGLSKRQAADVLKENVSLTNIILPHIYGEGAKPFYNNVTATLIDQIIHEKEVEINPDGVVSLLHAGDAVAIAIDCVEKKNVCDLRPEGADISIPELYKLVLNMHDMYERNIYPDFQSDLELKLFNAYRFATYPDLWPRGLKLNEDVRGVLFEAVKGGGSGQTFVSTTKPGVTRGDHFHINKVERFLVIQGDAVIRMRKVNGEVVHEFKVSGSSPSVVDMPTMYTHSIENVGSCDLTTLFWSHEIFDPDKPDTYADVVMR